MMIWGMTGNPHFRLRNSYFQRRLPATGFSQIREVHKTFDVNKNTILELKNINGSIKISGWDKDFVDFQATMKTNKDNEEFDKVDIVIKQDEVLSIETEHLTKNPNVSVSYELSVPRSLFLKSIRSSNGSITIEDAGEVETVFRCRPSQEASGYADVAGNWTAGKIFV